MDCDLTESHVWDADANDWVPIGSHNQLHLHNLKMQSFLKALAGGHQLPPEKLAELAGKALEMPGITNLRDEEN